MLPKEGILEVGANLCSRIVVTTLPKSPGVPHTYTCGAWDIGSTECIVTPERKDGKNEQRSTTLYSKTSRRSADNNLASYLGVE